MGLFLGQLRVLLNKNWCHTYRVWQVTIVQLFSPIAFLFVLYLLQHVYNSNNGPQGSSAFTPSFESIQMSLPSCDELGLNDAPPFYHLMVVSASSNSSSIASFLEQLASRISQNNGATPLTVGDDLYENTDIVVVSNASLVDQYILQFPGYVLSTVYFTSLNSSTEMDDTPMKNFKSNYNFSFSDYSVVVGFNSSNNDGLFYSNFITNNNNGNNYYMNDKSTNPFFPFETNIYSSSTVLLLLQKSLYEIITNVTFNYNNIQMSGYPELPQALQSQNSDSIVSSLGGLWFYCPCMLNFITYTNLIINEKEKKKRQGMNLMGLNTMAYWLSWVLMLTLIASLHSVVFQLFGYFVFQFSFIRNTNFFLSFLAYFLFSFSIIPFACLFSVIISSSATANTICFLVFVAGFFIQLLFTNFNIYDWYYDSNVHLIFSLLYPPFNFAKYFVDVNTLLAQLDGQKLGFSEASKDMYVQNSNNQFFNAPPLIATFYNYCYNFLIFSILFFYLDLVLPAPHHIPLHPFFFLQPSFYRSLKESNRNFELLNTQTIVEIRGLSKIYTKFSFKRLFNKSAESGDITALQPLNLSLPPNILFCLLGQNGAGKTTTIELLTGLQRATAGDAYVYGLPISTHMNTIRKSMGFCPQFDILFDYMTAREHLKLFAILKGLPDSSSDSVIEEQLRAVNLLHVADKRVDTFSGGMKRRLSVCISAIGHPSIIFMDEPTTGMDPASRKEVWDLIVKLKQGRIIFLTTHAMEEAEVLSDQIGILSKGKLIAFDTPLALKSKYGQGYHLSLSATPEFSEAIQSFVREHLEDANLIESHAGHLTFEVKESNLDAIKTLLSYLCTDDNPLAGHITDWSLTHTSMEDVFLGLTKAEANDDD